MKKIIYFLVLSLVVMNIISCQKTDSDNSPNILKFDIKPVPATKNYLVGVNYLFAPTFGNVLYKSLFVQTPVLGEYKNIKSAITGSTALVVDSQMVWMNKAKVDFIVVTIRSGSKALSSYQSDTSYLNRVLSSPFLGNLKIAIAYDFSGLGLGSTYPSPSDSSMIIEKKAGALANYIKDYTTFLSPYFNKPNYLKLGNKKVVFLLNAYRLFAKSSPNVSKQLRDSLAKKSHEIFLVGQQQVWSPPERYENRFRNAVDAIYHENFLNIPTNDLTRWYNFHQCTFLNWQYSKQIFNSWGVEYVPNIGPSYNSNLNSPNAISPYYNPFFTKDTTFFVKYCDVAKANADASNLILVDTWNNWSYTSQVEPAKEYGETYLKILRDQFKLK